MNEKRSFFSRMGSPLCGPSFRKIDRREFCKNSSNMPSYSRWNDLFRRKKSTDASFAKIHQNGTPLCGKRTFSWFFLQIDPDPRIREFCANKNRSTDYTTPPLMDFGGFLQNSRLSIFCAEKNRSADCTTSYLMNFCKTRVCRFSGNLRISEPEIFWNLRIWIKMN